MYGRINTKKHLHSSVSKIEGFVKALKAMKPFILGRKFVVYTDNWSVLKLIQGQSKQDTVVRVLK